MTPERIALMLEPDTETYCARCDDRIAEVERAFIRESEADAPYTPSLYCSEECRDAAEQDAYETACAPQ